MHSLFLFYSFELVDEYSFPLLRNEAYSFQFIYDTFTYNNNIQNTDIMLYPNVKHSYSTEIPYMSRVAVFFLDKCRECLRVRFECLICILIEARIETKR